MKYREIEYSGIKAPVYGFAVSEEIVGKAMKGNRDKVIFVTKSGLRWNLDNPKGTIHFYATNNGVSKEKTDKPVYKYLNPKSIRYEIEYSLRRLQTDYIDLYQTH